MYAVALMMSAAISSAASKLPYDYFHAGNVIGAIQWFGLIVAVGVLVGAAILRRYAEWHGVSDEHIRRLTWWVMAFGFLGAHELDALAYHTEPSLVVQPASWWPLGVQLWPSNWPLVLRLWDGISSYGGFIGGAIGFFAYVWWKRLPVRLMADTTILGFLPAFSIGRIGCSVVSDHIGSAVDLSKWYAGLGVDYPTNFGNPGGPIDHLVQMDAISHTGLVHDGMIRAWNLGLIELLYLIPVNALLLWLAFRPSKRLNAGLIPVFLGILYAPVRFFLEFLRPNETDPRYLSMTFAQWASLLAFGGAIYVAMRVMKNGEPAETVASTSGEAQRRLKLILNEEAAAAKANKDAPDVKDEKAAKADAKPAKKAAKTDAKADDDEELAKEAIAAGKAKPSDEAAKSDEA